MSDLAVYRSSALTQSVSRIAEIERLTKYSIGARAELSEFAVQEVKRTLAQAAQLVPQNMTPEQLSRFKAETRAYLATIDSIGSAATQRIMGAVNEILQLPAGK